jgi:hypothetical protein
MAVPAHATHPDELSETEREALISAAVWYAKRHEGMIAALADDRSARAVAARARYQELYDALAKLGVRLYRPQGIRPAA